jgi:hypothetical protein
MRGRGQPDLPRIEGYLVFKGRVWLHARYAGTVAEAHQRGRPWHVVARDPAGLMWQIHPETNTEGNR